MDREDDGSACVPEVGPSTQSSGHEAFARAQVRAAPFPRSAFVAPLSLVVVGDVQDSNLRPSRAMQAEGPGQVPGRLRRCMQAAQSVLFRSTASGEVWRRGWAISHWISASPTLA